MCTMRVPSVLRRMRARVRCAPRRRAGGLRKARGHASELEAEHFGWGGLARTGGDEAEAAGGDLRRKQARVSGSGVGCSEKRNGAPRGCPWCRGLNARRGAREWVGKACACVRVVQWQRALSAVYPGWSTNKGRGSVIGARVRVRGCVRVQRGSGHKLTSDCQQNREHTVRRGWRGAWFEVLALWFESFPDYTRTPAQPRSGSSERTRRGGVGKGACKGTGSPCAPARCCPPAACARCASRRWAWRSSSTTRLSASSKNRRRR